MPTGTAQAQDVQDLLRYLPTDHEAPSAPSGLLATSDLCRATRRVAPLQRLPREIGSAAWPPANEASAASSLQSVPRVPRGPSALAGIPMPTAHGLRLALSFIRSFQRGQTATHAAQRARCKDGSRAGGSAIYRWVTLSRQVAMLISHAGSQREFALPEQYLLEINTVPRCARSAREYPRVPVSAREYP